jgi:ATP-dependent DNA helicase DinG
MTDYIEETFGAGGYIARARAANYEVREGQIALARAVDEGMRTHRHVLAEAPCGTGKGYAYAVPAIHRAHEDDSVTVIATANIALQTQLMRDDLPFLKNALPWDFRYDLIKGRNNYACKYKIDQLDLMRSYGAYGAPGTSEYENYGLSAEQGEMLNALLAWSDVTETGDREESSCPGGLHPAWSKISVGGDECLRGGCRFRDSCWSEIQRANAHRARIIVTNYNVLFADAWVRHLSASGHARVLPEYDYLVMDEAHEAARIARDFFGKSITYKRFRRLANFIESELGLAVLAKELTSTAYQLLQAVGYYTQTDTYRRNGCLSGQDMLDFTPTDDILKKTQKALHDATKSWDNTSKEERERGLQKAKAADVMHNHAYQLRNDLEEALKAPAKDRVYWIELRNKVGMPAAIESRPLGVSKLLQTFVFKDVASATLTSATLTTAGTFKLIRSEMGFDDSPVVEIVARSPFNFVRQSRLVVAAKTLPVPRSQNRQYYNEAVLPIYHEVLDVWPGRTLCLFTAKSDLEFVHKSLQTRDGDRQLFKQGEWPRNTLVDWFRQNGTSILMGVDSFWTGVDVPEPKAIIIHKLPFPRFDIVNRAIQTQMGDAFFNERYLPWMITRFRQGIGRLIRQKNDYGFVVCLDRRGFDAGYAPTVRASLPFGPAWIRTDRFDMVRRFLTTQETA